VCNFPEALSAPGFGFQEVEGAQGGAEVGGLSPGVLLGEGVLAQIADHFLGAGEEEALGAEELQVT